MTLPAMAVGDAAAHATYDTGDGVSKTPGTSHWLPTPISNASEPSHQYLAFYEPGENRSSSVFSKHERLSHFLHASLPSKEDTERICNATRHPSVLPHEAMTVPYVDLSQSDRRTQYDLLDVPERHEHPVLIARHMLLLATAIAHLDPHCCDEIEGLSESPRVIMERLAHLSISLVTTNDALLGSIEGLECIIIESVYQSTRGNLRRSWVSCRRAMGIAQLMALNRPEHHAQYQVFQPGVKHYPQLLWFRIVYFDRLICLMLGLSQGSLDQSMASDAMFDGDTPVGRLERIHCVIASRILERNESHPGSRDLALTEDLDKELQRAARSQPSKWWLIPILNTTSTDSLTLFWGTRRLFAQVVHYSLLNQLHLPYMLRSSSAERSYEYSRITCINASREILSRFITLHSVNGISYSCRIIDFLTLMAAMTLLLAHLDSHFWGAENLLSHQYYSDRAMIEQTQETMEEVDRLNSDPLSAQSADLLRRLLIIEAEAPDSHRQGARRVSVFNIGLATPSSSADDDDTILSMHIPYFGIIKITREGISKEVTRSHIATSRLAGLQGVDRSHTFSDESRSETQVHRSELGGHSEIPNGVQAVTSVDGSSQMTIPYTNASAQPGTLTNSTIAMSGVDSLQTDLLDPLWEYSTHPGLAAEGEDWALQGIDLAFFESLISVSNIGDRDASMHN
ncbi:hypothetical protein MMC10_001929 [Thelotrema lepadinum]|nr:hypothetical protein [Thelotrema lepadinum]